MPAVTGIAWRDQGIEDMKERSARRAPNPHLHVVRDGVFRDVSETVPRHELPCLSTTQVGDVLGRLL
jgi:hypothetical protein